MTKQISSTLKGILENEIVEKIRDRSSNILPIIKEVKDYWNYDLYSRKPSPACTEDGVFQGTSLDMAAFLYALVDRGAFINLKGKYTALRESVLKEGEIITSKEDRHGKIVRLVSNQDTLNFSIGIIDQNVMTTDSCGKLRNYAITDFSGKWYPGWNRIEFMPNEKENKFITENDLYYGNTISFSYFIHPNRWLSFFGKYYFITKLLITRLKDEVKYLKMVSKDMEGSKILYPYVDNSYKYNIGKSIPQGNKKNIQVSAFHVELDVPDYNSNFQEYEFNTNGFVEVTRKVIECKKAISSLQFITRATEFAHFQKPEAFPAWIKNTKWEQDYVIPGKRKKWQRLVLFQDKVGERAVAVRKRTFLKTETVSTSYGES